VKKSIYRNQGRKIKPDFCWIFFNAGGCVYWWKWNPFCNIKDVMYWWNFNPFLIYGMWWNLNPAYNIWELMNPHRHCYGQETRTNEPTSPLLRARDED
jgi:hypothetical protein